MWVFRVLILIIYSFPYAYFGMYKDFTNGSMSGYGLMVIVLITLLIVCEKTNNLGISILGNIITFIVSYKFVFNLNCEKAMWYFKPFGIDGSLKFDSIVVVIIQLVIIIVMKMYKSK